MMRNIFIAILFVLISISHNAIGQAKIIDEVVAVIGDKRVLYSDLEKGILQMKEAGDKVYDDTRCKILEQLLVRKLLLNQAEVDSIEVTESQVEGELDNRMQYFI